MTTGLARIGGAPFTGIVEVAYTSKLTGGHRAHAKGAAHLCRHNTRTWR